MHGSDRWDSQAPRDPASTTSGRYPCVWNTSGRRRRHASAMAARSARYAREVTRTVSRPRRDRSAAEGTGDPCPVARDCGDRHRVSQRLMTGRQRANHLLQPADVARSEAMKDSQRTRPIRCDVSNRKGAGSPQRHTSQRSRPGCTEESHHRTQAGVVVVTRPGAPRANVSGACTGDRRRPRTSGCGHRPGTSCRSAPAELAQGALHEGNGKSIPASIASCTEPRNVR